MRRDWDGREGSPLSNKRVVRCANSARPLGAAAGCRMAHNLLSKAG
jgi:hypothetical protein